MPFPMFTRGKFHTSKHEKTLKFSDFVVYFSTFGNTDISVYKCIISCNCFYRKRVRRLPLTTVGNYIVNVHILVLVYVEYC